MKVLSLLLRNTGRHQLTITNHRLNESPELIAQESAKVSRSGDILSRLNESPELIAQEFMVDQIHDKRTYGLNESPELIAQE